MIQYGIFILIIIAAVVSLCIMRTLLKEPVNIRMGVCFYAAYYFMFAVLKSYLGSANLTLYQSFWEASAKTYIHYGIPLIIIAVILPVALWFILKKYIGELMDWMASALMVMLAVVGLVLGKITNICYISVFLLGIVISFSATFILKKKLQFAAGDDLKKIAKKYWAVDLLPVFLTVFYYPQELFFSNQSEFYNSYISLALILLLGMVVIWTLIMIAVSVLPRTWIDICQALIFAVSILAYLQAMFFNGRMEELSGGSQNWDVSAIAINLLIWVVGIAISIICARKLKNYKKVIHYASLYLMVVLSVTVVTLIVQNASSLNEVRSALTTDGELVIANDNNVVVFVLDMFDARNMERIVVDSPEFVAPLNDFTFYNNTVSRYIMTTFAIPHLLTGAEWRGQYDGVWYNKYAYYGDTFLKDLYENNIDIGVYTDAKLLGESHHQLVRNYRDDVLQKSDIIETVNTMSRTSLYTTMPFIIKNKYNYYTGDLRRMVVSGEVWDDSNDVPFYEDIVREGISIDETLNGSFRFYHMRGAHDPYYLSDDIKVDRTHTKATSESQEKGVLKIVYEYINQLKAVGKYDDTTIIITADHGYASWYDQDMKCMVDVSMPLLMVKRAGQVGDGLTYNSAPVNQIEMLSTILDVYEMDYSRYGERLEDINEGVDRKRPFGFARPTIGVLDGNVVGDAHSVGNWIVERFEDVEVNY